jgi:predicted nucleotidyltransferase
MDFKSYAKTNLIYRTLVGSHIYGTNVPESDLDYVGIFVEPKEAIFGLGRVNEVDCGTKEDKSKPNGPDDIDDKSFAFRRFVELAATKSNPNVLELLYVRENHVQYINEWGRLLLANRELFISKRAYDSFTGFAYSQLKRFEQSNRNPHGGREHIVNKYGFDTKYIMHVVRMYMEGTELLTDGEMRLPLTHNRLLLDMRLGQFTKEKCLEIAEEWKAKIEQARLISTLPTRPNPDKVNAFLVDFYERYWGYNSYSCNGKLIKEQLLQLANSIT